MRDRHKKGGKTQELKDFNLITWHGQRSGPKGLLTLARTAHCGQSALSKSRPGKGGSVTPGKSRGAESTEFMGPGSELQDKEMRLRLGPGTRTNERGLGSSRIGEEGSSLSWSGEAGSGDPRGVKRGEQVNSKVGADLSAAVRVQHKHRCSGSCPQRSDREYKLLVLVDTQEALVSVQLFHSLEAESGIVVG
ncbi:hypothetical protein EYF80_002074 [Liparis tanakae]|uniref:Uncharacterized protein n=1 Tax=Liparis tanakae TaxID=230148 RepID=A0A4Z2JCK5_9TELE|nr:hypothetical protein EYF80_002074 [Liparis tanakae]